MKLKFTSGEAFAPEATQIEWRDEKLHFQLANGAYVWKPSTSTVPTAEDWTEFWATVEKIGVWEWKAEYYECVMDGWSWELALEHEGRKLHSTGSNACPGGGSFEQFQQALLKLTGITKSK